MHKYHSLIYLLLLSAASPTHSMFNNLLDALLGPVESPPQETQHRRPHTLELRSTSPSNSRSNSDYPSDFEEEPLPAAAAKTHLITNDSFDAPIVLTDPSSLPRLSQPNVSPHADSPKKTTATPQPLAKTPSIEDCVMVSGETQPQTPYVRPQFPTQNSNYCQTGLLKVVTGDQKGVSETSLAYLLRLIAQGKLLSAMDANPAKTTESNDPKIRSRFAQALSEWLDLESQDVSNSSQSRESSRQETLTTLQRRYEEAQLILDALALPVAKGSLSEAETKAFCHRIKKARKNYTESHQELAQEWRDTSEMFKDLETQLRSQIPNPDQAGIAPVTPTIALLDQFPTTKTDAQLSTKEKRRQLEAKQLRLNQQLQNEIDMLRLAEERQLQAASDATPITPRRILVPTTHGLEQQLLPKQIGHK